MATTMRLIDLFPTDPDDRVMAVVVLLFLLFSAGVVVGWVAKRGNVKRREATPSDLPEWVPPASRH